MREACVHCRVAADVVETSQESVMTPRGEVAYQVAHLACGHQHVTETGVTGPAPGTPWAPGAAATVRYKDRHTLAAHAAERAMWESEWP